MNANDKGILPEPRGCRMALFGFTLGASALMFELMVGNSVGVPHVAAIPFALCAMLFSLAAWWRIRVAAGALTGRWAAIWGMVVAVGVLANYGRLVMTGGAINSAEKQRNQRHCVNQLRMMDGAKEQWALENHRTAADAPTEFDIFGPRKYIPVRYICPSRGSYSLNNMSNKPSCNFPGHTL